MTVESSARNVRSRRDRKLRRVSYLFRSATEARVRLNSRSILTAMMKSFSCRPLSFLVCKETFAWPQPKQTSYWLRVFGFSGLEELIGKVDSGERGVTMAILK